MSIPTHDPWRTERDRAEAKPIAAHFWINDNGAEIIMSEQHDVLIGDDSDYGGIAFHIGDEVTFTVNESDLLEAIAETLRK